MSKIGFVGMGNMAKALASGFIKSVRNFRQYFFAGINIPN